MSIENKKAENNTMDRESNVAVIREFYNALVRGNVPTSSSTQRPSGGHPSQYLGVEHSMVMRSFASLSENSSTVRGAEPRGAPVS
jgi:hypothetical protein